VISNGPIKACFCTEEDSVDESCCVLDVILPAYQIADLLKEANNVSSNILHYLLGLFIVFVCVLLFWQVEM